MKFFLKVIWQKENPDLGETRKAIEYYEQARQSAERLGIHGLKEKICEQSLEIACKIEHPRGEGDALFNMSLALYKLGQRPEAIDHAKAALGIFEQIESPDAEIARRKLSEWQG